MFDVSDSKKAKDWWDKGQIIATALGAIGVPLIVFIVGSAISSNLKNQDSQTKLIELSINILTSKSITQENQAIRTWALDVIDMYSEVKMNELQKNILLSNPILYESEEIYSEITTVCPNMPVAVVVQDPSRSHKDGYVNFAKYEKLIADARICYVTSTEQDEITTKRIVGTIQNDLRENSQLDRGYISVDGNRIYKPCLNFNFYIQDVPYASINGVESRGSFGTKCIVSIWLD